MMMMMMMNFIHVLMYLVDANWGHNIKIKVNNEYWDTEVSVLSRQKKSKILSTTSAFSFCLPPSTLIHFHVKMQTFWYIFAYGPPTENDYGNGSFLALFSKAANFTLFTLETEHFQKASDTFETVSKWFCFYQHFQASVW